jgi:hypothetical protein
VSITSLTKSAPSRAFVSAVRPHGSSPDADENRPGDVVWIPPAEKHWHGASPTTAMTHIAIQEKLDGKVVDWMEQVSDETIPRRDVRGAARARRFGSSRTIPSSLRVTLPRQIFQTP